MHVGIIGSPISTSIHEYLYALKDRGIVIVSVDEPTNTLKEHDIFIEELTRTDFSYHLLPDKIDFYATLDAASPDQFKYIAPNFDFSLPYHRPKSTTRSLMRPKAFHHFDIDYG